MGLKRDKMSSHDQVDCNADIYSIEDVHVGGVIDHMYVITSKASTGADFHFKRSNTALRHPNLYQQQLS